MEKCKMASTHVPPPEPPPTTTRTHPRQRRTEAGALVRLLRECAQDSGGILPAVCYSEKSRDKEAEGGFLSSGHAPPLPLLNRRP